jgi:hypothetical protein
VVKASIFLLPIIIIIGLILASPILTRLRRRRIQNKLFPLHWVAILQQNIPIYNYLPLLLRKRLHRHINVFLAEKKFKGCGGLQITEEIKLTIAGQASLLLLNERRRYYPKLYSILVYPSAFMGSNTTPIGDSYLEEQQPRAGESWHIGLVVLSWQPIQYDMKNWQDGRNVVLHEFAHQLDQEDGSVQGVPLLQKRSDYQTWARVFSQEFQQLCSDVERGLETVIDEYGATNPAEFFAVATETFFEKSELMKRKHPELYQELKRFYQLDPVEWI